MIYIIAYNFDWTDVCKNSDYGELYSELTALYEEECASDISPALSYSKYARFEKDGNRSVYDGDYSLRRTRLSVTAMMYLIHEREETLARLQDMIWDICGEFSWALPAHTAKCESIEQKRLFVDLFSAETAFVLSEVCVMLGDRLDKQIRDRIQYEIRVRVMDSFINTRFWWETAPHNWASVCAGNIGGAAVNLFPELLPFIRPRLDAAMRSFMSSFKEDGACMEGVSYWLYGFGAFAMYYDKLSELNEDALSVFRDAKVREVAKFYNRACLDGAVAMTFADCQPNALYHLDLLLFLRGVYGDEIKIPPMRYRIKMDRKNLYTISRSFMRYDKSLISDGIDNFSHFFRRSQIYVTKTDLYSFAAKGGNNDEPHNHNDVGSFLISVGEEQVLCDIGVGTYNKEYFDESTRYNLLGNGSQGHSVPIIDGAFQPAGVAYRAENASFDNGVFSMDIAPAYRALKGKVIRSFKPREDGITLSDSYSLESAADITERLVSYIKPEPERGRIVWGRLTLEFDPELFDVLISRERYRNNFKGVFDVWLTDLKLREKRCRLDAEFNIKIQKEISHT